MVYIYILLCANDMYYIGKTNDPEFRIEKHIENIGSLFTKKYPPIRLHQLIPDCDDFDEDKYEYSIIKRILEQPDYIKIPQEDKRIINHMLF